MNRRKLLVAGLVSLTSIMSPLTWAQNTWPDRPVRLLVGYAPGGPVDTTARVFAKYFGEKIGQVVVVENTPGASGMIAASNTAKATSDGYTLNFVASPTMTMSPQVQRSHLFDPRTDFSLIGMVVDYENVLLVGPQIKANSLKDLLDYAKKHPEAVSYGSAGIGASNHLSAALMERMADVNMLHVPYKGNSPAMVDVIGGKVTFMFDIISTALPFIQSGQARPLAVTSKTRNPQLPNVPTMAESGMPDYEVTGWYALIGPQKISPEISDKIAHALSLVKQDQSFQTAMLDSGYTIDMGDKQVLQKRINDEFKLWGDVVKSANILAE